jgi:predicted DsbA family dithiol-disulfide isomerase
VEWLPFDLHPEYPPEGVPKTQLETRYGPGIHERTKAAIESAGFAYNPPETIPNSRRALAVTELARDREVHEPVHTRLMHAYWSEGADLGDEDVLLDLAGEGGLDPGEAREAMTSTFYVERVLESTRTANMHGINAIPAFVLDHRLLVMGAHPHETFEQAIALLEKEGTQLVQPDSPPAPKAQ